MNDLFPKPIQELPLADIPMKGVEARLSQGVSHQILFMKFSEDVYLPEHSHEAQWGIVLEGKIELTIDGRKSTFVKGDRYYIPRGVVHSGKVFAGYADVTFFNEKDRYRVVGGYFVVN
ncbi:cupin domain-containing protein [Marinilabilia sp.]|uniref:cupin domain-containing protein n=1 Tax=Marinilabilia sp. TaxID=2021252 RepID=UPI0025C30054|nr:cupin domain-containing protein [Marinilabilia sp.]